MIFFKENFVRNVVFLKLNTRRSSKFCYLMASTMGFIFFLTVIANAAEKIIPGNAKMEAEFTKLGHKRKIEKEFHLYATDGYRRMADGEVIYFWGFTHARNFANVGEIKTKEERAAKLLPLKVPGDELRLKSGKNYVIVLHNTGWYETEEHSGVNNVAHTIHFHGLDLIPYVDGVPKLPYPAVYPGEVFRYLLTIPPDIEGSYMGHCHVDSTNHIMAGMYFPLIIEKKPGQIYGYKFDREYTIFFSEVDSEYMEMLRTLGYTRRGLDWQSNYFMINGRIFTDNLKNPLSTVNDPRSRIVAYDGETVLIRLMAIGYDHIYSWHPHGHHGTAIGKDGRKLNSPIEHDTLLIGSGERYDILYKIPPASSERICLSCNIGPGISIAHDHNMKGMVSAGIYPHGAMTIFDIRSKSPKMQD